MRIKLLHCGDLHLEAPFTSLSDVDGRPGQRRQELKQILGRIVELAAAEQVDLLLICGDLYEHGYTRKSTMHFICDQLQKIPEIPVLIIPGNHDPATPDSFYKNLSWPSNVHILKEDNTFYEHSDTYTRVYGCLPSVGKLDRAGINILMFHGTLDMPFSTDAYQPVFSTELEECGFDYCALGHFHSRIQGAGVKKRIFNPGSPEPLGFDEEGEHGVFITTIEKQPGEDSNVQAVFKMLNLRHFVNMNVQVGGCLTDEQVALKTASAMEDAAGSEDFYHITLQGYLSHDFRIDAFIVAGLLKDRAFYIKITDHTTPDYDFEQIADEPGLRGLFTRKMLDRAAKAPGAEERRLVMQALYYGMEAIDEGSVCI